jgi:flagellar protein FlaJ
MPGRLQRIRDAIEKGDSYDVTQARRGELERADEVAKRMTAGGKVESPQAARIKYGVAEWDFYRIDVGKNPGAGIRNAAAAYSALKLILAPLARLFSRMPSARGLRRDLPASGLTLNQSAYMAIATTASAALGTAVTLIALALTAFGKVQPLNSVLLSISIGVVAFTASNLLLLVYPGRIAKKRAAQIDRELPFALRHLATQVRAGVPFQRAMESVEQGGYGALSTEIRKFLLSLEAMGIEDALEAMHERTKSNGLRQAVTQINRSLRTGGSLADVISGIADDASYESRMRIRDFTEKLNLVAIVFTMVAVVTPVVLTIVASVVQLPLLGGSFSPVLVALAFAAIALLSVGILAFIKSIEPTA